MKAYKTEINPTNEQKQLIHQHFGNTRWVYNQYISTNLERLENNQPIISGYDFSKQLNHDPNTPIWLKIVSSQAIKRAIMNGEKAFKKYLKGLTGKPQFKKKSKDNRFYSVNRIKVERHRIRVPKIGWLRLKEFGYIPENVKSVTISMKNNRYYISCVVHEQSDERIETNDFGIGIDFGLSHQFITQTDKVESINRSKRVKKLEKRLKQKQRSLSRKYRNNMTNIVYYKSGKRKGQIKSFDWVKPLKDCQNIHKNQLNVNKLYERLTRIRTDYNQKALRSIIKQKPRFIAIEDLNIKGLMKNKHLSKAIANAQWGMCRVFLQQQCQKYGIELRVIDRFYPSSKLCSNCGHKNKELKLKDREWVCPNCHMHHDRDMNAAMNIRNCQHYTVLTAV